MENIPNENMVTLEKSLGRKLEKALAYARYKERGVASNPFNIEFGGNIWKIKVGRDDELIEGIENMKEMADKNSKMLNVLGSHGMGKSLFIRLLRDLAVKFNDELNFDKILLIKNNQEFKAGFVESKFLEGPNGEIYKVPAPLISEVSKASKPFLIFIDDADIIFQDYPKIFSDLSHLDNLFVIAAWNTSAWERAKQRPDIKFPSPEILMLKKISEKECEEIISKRISQFKISERADELFSSRVITAVARLARGSPHRVIRLSKRLLSFIIESDILKIDLDETFNEFLGGVEDITYEELMKKMELLNPSQRKIIEEMKTIVEGDAKTIGDLVGLTRVGALKQLKQLEKMGFINSTDKGRKTIYQLKEEIEYGIDDQ